MSDGERAERRTAIETIRRYHEAASRVARARISIARTSHCVTLI
jgi:hypothetical protein